jgi:hypothetical protein
MQEAESQHPEDGVAVWFGHVNADEAVTHQFYEALGFTVTATARNMPSPAKAIGHYSIGRPGSWIYRKL